jgi:hypothetical protein
VISSAIPPLKHEDWWRRADKRLNDGFGVVVGSQTNRTARPDDRSAHDEEQNRSDGNGWQQ